MTTENWLTLFPSLSGLPEPVNRELAALAAMKVPSGTVLFRDGDACQGYVFVLNGSIRVQKMDSEGREIVLYRVEDGQTCMLTTSCLLGDRAYPAEGVAEVETELVLIPAKRFDELLSNSGFRKFTLGMISERIADLMALIEDVAFGRMDARLIRRLMELDDGSHTLRMTHQKLATELGTAREVVSRILKDFERRGHVVLGRGEITLIDLDALWHIATTDV